MEAMMRDFDAYLSSRVSDANRRTVMRVILKLSNGESAIVAGDRFPNLVDVNLTFDDITPELVAVARDWAPRKGTHRIDRSNGWALHHPLSKALQYKREVLEPRAEKQKADAIAARLVKEMEPLSTDAIRARGKRKHWKVSEHTAQNEERVTSTHEFLKAFKAQLADHDPDWRFIDEYPFGNRRRCDIYLTNGRQHIIVESKTKNLLAGLGQVLHYGDMARQTIDMQTPPVLVVALQAEPLADDEFSCASRGVHVWCPGRHVLPPPQNARR